MIAIAREMQSRIVRLYGFEPDMQLLEVCMTIYENDCIFNEHPWLVLTVVVIVEDRCFSS